MRQPDPVLQAILDAIGAEAVDASAAGSADVIGRLERLARMIKAALLLMEGL